MKCQFIKANKEPCEANRIKGSNFCFRHDPVSKEANMIASSKGGQNRALQGVYGQEVTLQTPKDVKNFLGTVITAVWTGQVPVPVGSSMGFLTRCWLDAYEASDLESKINQLEEKINKIAV